MHSLHEVGRFFPVLLLQAESNLLDYRSLHAILQNALVKVIVKTLQVVLIISIIERSWTRGSSSSG